MVRLTTITNNGGHRKVDLISVRLTIGFNRRITCG
jgi:hypothetical protein